MILTILSQIQTVGAEHLKDFMLIAIAAVAVGTNIASWVNTRKAQQRVISFSDDYITSKQCGIVHAALDRRLADLERLDKKLDSMRSENEQRAANIYTHTNQMETNFSAQIQALPAQIIAMLKNTGAFR